MLQLLRHFISLFIALEMLFGSAFANSCSAAQ